MPTLDEWHSEVDRALFGPDDDAPPQPEQLGSLDFPVAAEGESEHHVVDAGTLDAALFGAQEARAVTVPAPLPEPVAPSPVPDDGHEIFAGEESFEENRTFAGDEHETIVAELADDVEDLVEPTGPERGRRRAWVVVGFTALVVVIGGTAGALMVGRSDDSRQKGTPVSPRTTVATTTTQPPPTTLPVPETTAPPVTSARPPASTAPRTPATSRRTVPPPAPPSVEPEPPPPPPPPTEPPPTSPPTAPPSTSVL